MLAASAAGIDPETFVAIFTAATRSISSGDLQKPSSMSSMLHEEAKTPLDIFDSNEMAVIARYKNGRKRSSASGPSDVSPCSVSRSDSGRLDEKTGQTPKLAQPKLAKVAFVPGKNRGWKRSSSGVFSLLSLTCTLPTISDDESVRSATVSKNSNAASRGSSLESDWWRLSLGRNRVPQKGSIEFYCAKSDSDECLGRDWIGRQGDLGEGGTKEFVYGRSDTPDCDSFDGLRNSYVPSLALSEAEDVGVVLGKTRTSVTEGLHLSATNHTVVKGTEKSQDDAKATDQVQRELSEKGCTCNII
ncbi:hypothetical protein HDU96_008286 [Phlyctochytrium bullatum]|nr:hypothetical protein HDU96_008286 [Phlyctochytrium bullatum]